MQPKHLSWHGLLRAAIAAVAILALGLPAAAQAQAGAGIVKGSVTELATGHAIADALVKLEGMPRSTESAADGTFTLTGIPAGARDVIVSALGYASGRYRVVVRSGETTELRVVLSGDAVLLSDVVVSVSREAQSRAEATASIGVLSGEELRAARPHHPAEIVSRVPGAWVSNLSGEGHFTAIRQPITTKPVYAYLEDGVPIRSTGFFNHNALYEVNLPMAGRVEVIKGPGSALYGSDAIGGVVNSFTRAPTDAPSLEMFVEGGRFGYARGLATAANRWGSDALRADFNITRADSYRDGAPYSRQSGTVRWDHGIGEARLRTVVTVSHIDQPGDGGSDISEADFQNRPEANYTPVAFRRVMAMRASSTLERRQNLSLWTATLYGRYNSLDLLPSWQLSFDPQVWASENKSFGFLGRVRQTVLPLASNVIAGVDLEVSPGSRLEQEIVPGATAGVYQSYTLGQVQYDYGVTFWQASPYVQWEATPFDRLRIDAGLRFDYVGYRYDNHLTALATGSHRRPASTNATYQRLSPKLGATLRLADGVHAFASYRAAFRAPSESQLFRQGQAINTVDLEPVTADNYEAGLRAAIGNRLSLEATVYELDIHDDILTFFDPSSGLRTATNAGATKHRGVEVGLAARPIDALRFDVSWAVTRQTYQEWQPGTTVDYSGQEIELAPSNMGRAGLTWTPTWLGSGSLGAEWVHLGHYWMNPENTQRYDGFSVFNVSAAVPVTSGLQLVGRLQNLTDERFAETTSYNTFQGRRYRPGPPRSFYLGAQYAIGAAGGR